MKTAVKKFQKNMQLLAFEWTSNMEMLLSYQKFKQNKPPSQKTLDFGPLGMCELPELDITRGKVIKLKNYIATTFPMNNEKIPRVMKINEYDFEFFNLYYANQDGKIVI
jgi:hypothetical protein